MILCRGTYLVAEIGSTVPGYSPLNDHSLGYIIVLANSYVHI